VVVKSDVVLIGAKEARNYFNAMAKGLLNFRKPFDLIIIRMHKSWADSFKSGRRGNTKWAPNTEVTKIIKRGSNPLLGITGALRLSLTRVSSGSVLKKSKYKLELGTTIPYANIQNEGKEITVTDKMRRFIAGKYGIVLGDSIKIPARPFMFFTKKDIKQIERIFKLWIEKGARTGVW